MYRPQASNGSGIILICMGAFSMAAAAYLSVAAMKLYKEANCVYDTPLKTIADLHVPFKGTLP